MVTQISAASPSLNFHSGRVVLKKITVFTFQQFASTSHVKLRSFNYKLQVWVILGQDFAFRAAINISYRDIFMFNKFENCFTSVSNNIYWQKRLNWVFLMYVFAKILTYFPCKIEKFELEVVGMGNLGTGFCSQGSH